MSEQATAVARVEWDAFMRDHFTWQQGEHITLIGPTGSGKTTLALSLLPLRRYVVAYGTKPKDRTLDQLVKVDKWKRIETHDKFPAVIPRQGFRAVFWPRYRTHADKARQTWEIARNIEDTFARGGFCLFIDETWWFTHMMGLKDWLEALWTQGRSIGLSVVAGTQRPYYIPLLAYDQATHLFFWRDNDERNLKRISGLNGLNAGLVRDTVSTLAPHEVLYTNTRTGAMYVTKAPHRK